ncbi:MAG: hypothetical protein R3C56_20315 [Pirellulaceae bacterium]
MLADGGLGEKLEADDASNAEKSEEPEIDYGDWLRLPEGLDRRFREPYPTLVQSTLAGDVSSQMSLALLSQQIASTLARAGKIDEAYAFILQSGRAAAGWDAWGWSSYPLRRLLTFISMKPVRWPEVVN